MDRKDQPSPVAPNRGAEQVSGGAQAVLRARHLGPPIGLSRAALIAGMMVAMYRITRKVTIGALNVSALTTAFQS